MINGLRTIPLNEKPKFQTVVHIVVLTSRHTFYTAVELTKPPIDNKSD